jgi:MFS family permease
MVNSDPESGATGSAATSPSGLADKLRYVSRTFSAFGIPAYRLLWSSQVCSTTGMQVQMFARGLLAYELGGSAGAIGLVSLGQAIPQLLLSMVGGALADRIPRRKLMMTTQALNSVAAVIIALLVKADLMTVHYLFIAALFQGAIMSFGGPARQAFVVEIVGQKELMNALALNNSAMNLSRIGAPSLAGALVAVTWIDLGGLYFIQAGLNVVSMTLLFLLPLAMKRSTVAPAQPGPGQRAGAGGRGLGHQGSILQGLSDGFAYVLRNPTLLTLLALGLVPTLLGQAYQQFLPVFAKNVFGDGIDRNAHALGFMSTMTGVGAFTGALAVASLAEYRQRTLLQLAVGIGFGLSLALFAAQGNYALAVVMLAAIGFTSSSFQSLNSTMIMTVSDPAYYGRVMSINMLTFSLQAFGTFGIGYLIDWLGDVNQSPFHLQDVQIATLALGLIVTVFIAAVTVLNPSYRRLEQEDLRRAAAEHHSRRAPGSEAAAGVAGGS